MGTMGKSRLEKGGFPEEGINLALCENPLPPLDEAVEAARAEAPLSNHYTEPYSWKLKEMISGYAGVPVDNIHINAGSELILRQLFALYGERVHLISPTYYLFEEIGGEKIRTPLDEKEGFLFDIKKLRIPENTTLAVIVSPNNPTGTVFDIEENLELVESHPDTIFLIDEAFIEFGGRPACGLLSRYGNIVITRTFSKSFSLAGSRVGYVMAGNELIEHLNDNNDAYPLARTAEAAAMASLEHMDKIKDRVRLLKNLTKDFRGSLESLGIKTYPTETYFFLGKVPGMSAGDFARALRERNIHIRPITLPGQEDRFLRFATSTEENNRTVLEAIGELLEESRAR